MKKIEYGKKSVTKVEGNRTIEVSRSIVAGKFTPPKKVCTEESVEVRNRAEQDAVYIRFADEEERLRKTGRLLASSFHIRHSSSADERGTHYAVKKFTFLDNTTEYGV